MKNRKATSGKNKLKSKNIQPVFEVVLFYTVFGLLILSLMFTVKLLLDIQKNEIGEQVAINYDESGEVFL